MTLSGALLVVESVIDLLKVVARETSDPFTQRVVEAALRELHQHPALAQGVHEEAA